MIGRWNDTSPLIVTEINQVYLKILANAIFFLNFKSFWMQVCKAFLCKKPIISDWLFLVAGEPQISNFLEGFEMVVELWMFMNRQDA